MIDKRMAGFLLLSVLMHLGGLLLPLRHRTVGPHRPSEPPLAVQLSTGTRTALSAPATASPGPSPGRGAAPAPKKVMPPNAEDHAARPTESPPPPHPPPPHPPAAIDIRQALASVRAAAREGQGAPDVAGGPALPPTIASAVAAASRTAVIVESRGAAGEWVTRQGKTRCVTPLQLPFYMAGKSMVTQCDAWQG